MFVLGLLLLLATTGIFAIGIWSGGNPGVIALHLLAMLASVQISYLIGCLIAAQFPMRAKTTFEDTLHRSQAHSRRFS
jgi:membrane protein DedA with SNARE-associated domain